MRLRWTLSHLTEPTQSNTKCSVDYQPCTHDIPSNTKHSVDLYHAPTPMLCDVLVHMQCNYAIVYSYHAIYIMRAICSCLLMHHLPMHHLDIYIKTYTNFKKIIQSMPTYLYMYTLTSQVTTTRVVTFINL